MSTETTTNTKRHARTRRGCLTCRIRKKKCDSLRPSCTKCTRLHVQCLGYASDRPDWLKGDCAKAYTQAIKCFLSEYPAAKAYSDPVPFLVLKTTPEVEQWLSRDPGAFNPFFFDPELGGLRQWTPSAPPPADDTHGVQFPGNSGGEPPFSSHYEVHPGGGSPSHGPHTPSPVTPYIYLPETSFSGYPLNIDGAQNAPWSYGHEQYQSLQPIPYVPSQSVYDNPTHQGAATPSYYNQLNEHTVHYVAGPIILARQGAHAFPASKTRFDEAGAPVMWMF